MERKALPRKNNKKQVVEHFSNKEKNDLNQLNSEDENDEYELSEDELDEEEEESEEDEDLNDSYSSSDSEVDISYLNDQIINLKEISDDEQEESDFDSDKEEDIFSKVLNHNDAHIDVEDEGSKIVSNKKTECITHETKSSAVGLNVANVDEYEYDSSDEEDVLNTIGNIPYQWYKDYVHIGYDKNGRKIIKPPQEDEIDEFLRKMDDPNYWRTVRDNLNGQKVLLTDNDLNLIKRLHHSKCPDPSYDLHAPFIDFFSYEKMIHPVTNQPETKASFIPSVSEKRAISRLVSAIKKARLKPQSKPRKDGPFSFSYDLWEKEEIKSKKHDRYIAAPKLKPPGHAESYNPPPEYLFSEEEKQEWLSKDPDERRTNFIPRSYRSLRQVPAYPEFVKERFERCLDLYLCPRDRKNRVQVKPEDLIPQLPKPADLKPFPAIQSLLYSGHEGKVLAISFESTGQFFASGDDKGVLKIFEVLTGRCFKTVKFTGKITNVSWYPNSSRSILAVVIEKDVFILNVAIGQQPIVKQTEEYFTARTEEDTAITVNEEHVKWQVLTTEDKDLWDKCVRVIIKHQFEISQFTWHVGGEYFATVMPFGANKSLVIHHLTKRQSQVPFKKSQDIIKCVQFHPTRAYFFVATKKSIRVYDLIKQTLTKKLMVNTSEVSCLAIHPGGDNVLIGGVDPKVQWFDMDLSTRAYKTLRYHKKSVHSVQFHNRYPLFASASEDGTIVVCHGMVYEDMLQNALIVPVKVLKSAEDKESPMLQCAFHPTQPWLLACSSNTIKLFT